MGALVALLVRCCHGVSVAVSIRGMSGRVEGHFVEAVRA